MLFLYGVPENFNSWGERRSSEYLLLKQSFGTRTRREPARKSLQNYCFFLKYANIFAIFLEKKYFCCLNLAHMQNFY